MNQQKTLELQSFSCFFIYIDLISHVKLTEDSRVMENT